MRLIEKKCPNCGAGLEFKEEDKSCKCSYCHRSFEIERDNNLNVSDISEQFILKELEKNMEIANKLLNKMSFNSIPFIIVFCSAWLVIIGIIIYAIING